MEKLSVKSSLFITLFLLAIMWLVFFSERLLGIELGQYGLIPHSIIGLRGILFSPFIHGNLTHLVSNTLPFLILMTVLLNAYNNMGLWVLLLIHIFAGISLWLLGPYDGVPHIGMSGIIYGIAGFLVGSGIFRSDRKATAIAIFVVLMYGGMFWGFVPQNGVSWQGHLLGATVGFGLAYFFRNVAKEPIIFPEEEEEIEKHFLEE